MTTPPPPPHSSITPPGAPPPGFGDFATPPQAPQAHYGQPQYAQPPYGQPQYGQPQYGQAPYGQPQYGQPGYGYRSPNAKNWMNIVSLITGIVSCFGITAIAAIVFGHLGLSAAKSGEADNRGMGIAGLILGYLGLAASIAFFIFGAWIEIECAGNPSSEWCEGY